MGVCCRVIDLPDLGRANRRVFGYRIRPLALGPHARSDRAEERFDRSLDFLSFLVGSFARFLD